MIIAIRTGAVVALALHSGAFGGSAVPDPRAAEAASYYTVRLEDPKAVFVTRERFGAAGDGIADDTTALQKAIDAVQETTGEGVVFVPEGRYRLSATLHVWPGIRVVGYGTRRPAFVLGDRTPGYQDEAQPRYLVFFAGRRPRDASPPPDANPGTFYSALSNVDLEIGAGNEGAVGVRARYAQHCFTSHVEFRIGSGLAGIHEGGNVAEDVRFVGGDYGIWTGTPSPGWQLTLVDARFVGQRKAAIRESAAGLTLIRPQFRDVPTAIEIETGRPDDLFVKDARFENISGPALVVSLEQSPRTQINMENVACRGVGTFALFRESGRRLAASGGSYVVKAFSHGLHYADLGAAGETKTVFDAAPVATLPAAVPSDLAPLPPGETWVNALALGARGDGKTDDTAALQKAIDTHRTLYLPTGKYVVSDTLTLRPDSVLVGLHPSATQLVLPDRTPAFQGVGGPKPLLLAPKGGTTIVIGVGLYTNGINPRALSVQWMAGPRSMMNDVRFLGGHGTTGLDGKRENPYNNAHSADPDLARRWDSQYPSLWVTEGGGGTFFDLWTPSTFAAAGLLVSNTETSGRVYQMSSEHHVRYEVQLKNVANWELHALQTEAERGESGSALQLEVRDSRRITFSNLHVYRVISSDQPFPWAVKLTNSTDIHFRGMHCYSNSKVAYDWTVWGDGLGAGVKQREFAWLDVSGRAPQPAASAPSRVLEPAAVAERLASGFHNISGGAAGPAGDFYFVDARWQRIHRWSAMEHRLLTVADAPLQPVNLAFDTAGNLLVVSYAGNGTVYWLNAENRAGPPTLVAAQGAARRPRLSVILPTGDWRLQRDAHGALVPRAHHYLAPDGRTAVSATQAFVDGAMSWGVKSSDLIRAFGLQRARPGERVYLTSEADVATWSALVGDDGGLTELRPFVHQGGEGVAVDAEGKVFIAAGDVHVYDPAGTLVETIPVPGRPTQVVFGGPDGRTLFLPARDALYAVRTRVPGRTE
ncbi:MAG TPA: glycosyl hydrolase family 28-related protein [Vicinamibacteria bacterium]|nr:glycosyl hydrolase family 28-related protein [Vicinamibacteria bacterium]